MLVPLALSGILGAGLWLVFDSLTGGPDRRAPRPARSSHVEGLLRRFMHRAGIRGVPARDYVLFSLGSGLAGFVAALLIFNWVLVALVVGGVSTAFPTAYYARRGVRRPAEIQ